MTTAVHHTSKVCPTGEGRGATALGGCKTYYFSSSQGKNLFARTWSPPADSPTRGLVFVCHGYGEHLGWYEPLATALADKGLFVFGHDHVGHGQSDGSRCYVSEATEYVQDVLLHVANTRQQMPRLPCYIVGHSMGGMISISAVLSASGPSFAGAVLMGPLILPDPNEATPVKVTAARFVAWLCPYFPVGRLRSELITRDEEMLGRINKDELVYQGAIKAQWACACLDLLLQNKSSLNQFSTPFFILHGELDGLCALAGSKILYEVAPVKDKTLKVFPQALHNLYVETQDTRREAIRDTVDWIVQRLPPLPRT